MDGDTRLFAVVVGLAGISGVLQGSRYAVIPVLVGLNFSPAEISPIVSAVLLLSLGATIGVFLAGYRWAGRAAVPGAYGRFALALAVAALVGFGIVYLAALLLAEPGRPPEGALSVIADAGGAVGGLIGVPFVGLAGGAAAGYRSVTDRSWRQWPVEGDTSRLAAAVGSAGVAGFLHGLGPNVAPLLAEHHATLGLVTMAVDAVSLLSFAVTVGLFLAGYAWARRAAVPGAYGRFVVSLFGAALVGHGVGFLPAFFLFEEPLLPTIGFFGVLAIFLISVPVPALAGGAIAQYVSVMDEARRRRTRHP